MTPAILLATHAFIGAVLLIAVSMGGIHQTSCHQLYAQAEAGSDLAHDSFTALCAQP